MMTAWCCYMCICGQRSHRSSQDLTLTGETDILPLALSQIRESDSIVKARSGQLIVIGGLMSEKHENRNYRTPLLGDVPLLGKLFRSERKRSTPWSWVILLRRS